MVVEWSGWSIGIHCVFLNTSKSFTQKAILNIMRNGYTTLMWPYSAYLNIWGYLISSDMFYSGSSFTWNLIILPQNLFEWLRRPSEMILWKNTGKILVLSLQTYLGIVWKKKPVFRKDYMKMLDVFRLYSLKDIAI